MDFNNLLFLFVEKSRCYSIPDKNVLHNWEVCGITFYRSKAAVPVLVLLFVALWFILRGDLFSVLPCVILLCVFQSS